MKVYVAGSSMEIHPVKSIISVVRRAGHEIALDWTDEEGRIITPDTEDHWSNHRAEANEISQAEIEAARDSDLTIIVHPATVPGKGCWIEMGAALAGGKPVFILDPMDDSSIFFYNDKVTIMTYGELWDWLFPRPEIAKIPKETHGESASEATS